MNLRDLSEQSKEKLRGLRSDFKYAKVGYVRRGRFYIPVFGIICVWMMTMTLLFSTAIDEFPTMMLSEYLPFINRFGMVCITIWAMVIIPAVFMEYDKLNSIRFSINTLITWGCFWIATHIGLPQSTAGRLFWETFIASVAALIIVYFADKYINKKFKQKVKK